MYRIFASVILSFFFLSNIAWAESDCALAPPPKTNGNDIAKTTATGAALGGLIGGVWGNNSKGGDAKKGAIAGAIVGGLAGAAAGKVASDRRQEYTTQSAYLECEINYTQNQIDLREARIAKANSDLAVSKARVSELNNLYAANEASKADLVAMKQTLQAQTTSLESEMATCQSEINRLDMLLANATPQSGEDAQNLMNTKLELQEKRRLLSDQYAGLTGIRDQVLVASNSIPTQG